MKWVSRIFGFKSKNEVKGFIKENESEREIEIEKNQVFIEEETFRGSIVNTNE